MFTGDPAENSQELDRQYPPGWLWVGRAAYMLTLVLCIQALLSIGMLGSFWGSWMARLDPPELSRMCTVLADTPLDISIPVGNDILRVTRIAVGRMDFYGELVAEVSFCAYDRLPGGIVSQTLSNGTVVENQREEW